MAYSTGTVRFVAWTVSLFLSVGAVGGLGYLKYEQINAAMAEAASFPEPAETVELVTVGTAMVTDTVNVIGELQAVQLVELRIEVPGVVDQVGFSSGDEVRRGQVLVRIDTSAEQADLAAARVDAERTASEAARDEKLFDRGVTPAAIAEQTRALAAAAEARVQALETQIARKTIRAPFDGRVGITDLKPGQFVGVGDLIAQIVGLQDEVYVDFTVPQRSAVLIDRSRSVRVKLETLEATGAITAVDPLIDRATRSLGFRALVEDPAFVKAAGGLVRVILQTGGPEEKIVVPRTSIARSPYGDAVYVVADVNGQLRAASQQVRLGQTVGDHLIVILEGLEPGVVVAADGSFKLRDGALVMPLPDDREIDNPEAGDAESIEAAPLSDEQGVE